MKDRKGLLMRVGIDKTDGEYNAPINPRTNDYIYMPILQGKGDFIPGMKTSYNDLSSYFESWSQRNNADIQFPQHLNNKTCHLDPDFEFSTYGDQATGRGLRVADLKEWDFLAFFASFKPINKCDHNLIYALYGIMVVDKILKVRDMPENEYHKNAHTRIMNRNGEHLVVFAKPSLSGRFDRAIPIGEFRNRSYRVKKEMLEAWGNIGVKDGFIQRSVCPPWFEKPVQFLKWLESQQVKLFNNNWS
ncbi:MAG: hypothetical protein DU489_08075 [Nitrosomonas sp.]|uniref:Nmad3 family putative nucleotide modification protein n=1 Tax=Nitrosomonas sp. TaxID=42353 RepID=UPI0032EEB10E